MPWSLQRLLYPESTTIPYFAASCCRDGSLAVIEPLWVRETSGFPPMSQRVDTSYTCAHPTNNADTSLGRSCSTVLPSQSSPSVSVHRGILTSVRVSGIEEDGFCPTPRVTSPMLVGRDHTFQNWSVCQDRGPRWVGPHGLRWLQ